MTKSKIVENTFMLTLLNVFKLILPFFTLPYLTRVLSTDCYGSVAYVKAVMAYIQIFIDFGFMLSGTKEIVNVLDNKEKLNETAGEILLARIFVSVVALFFLVVLIFFIPILRENILFSFLSFINIFLSIFLFDYLFRGMEKMSVITIRFVVMKSISTILTFILISNDNDVIKIPLLDIAGSLVAVALIFVEMKKIEIFPKVCSIKKVFEKIKDSCVYFFSSVASTSFNALNTVIAGLFLSKTDIAYWSVSIQIIVAIQSLYSPLSDAIYPVMIKTKKLNVIKKSILIYLPIIFAGCIVAFFLSDIGMSIIGGKTYTAATPVFRMLIPAALFGFLSIIFGWPTLGAIGKTKQTTFSTVFVVLYQIAGLVFFIVTKKFTLINLAILRSSAEFFLFSIRLTFFLKYKYLFLNSKFTGETNEANL